MHFYHPIQQCAEQIYHTALLLSPTSSCLRNSYLRSITDDQLSHVTAFIGAPSTWGLLQRTIDTRPRELTCIATSGQGIIAACGDIVNIYDAVTGVLQQSLCTSEPVTKIQASPDGSTLFFMHPSSVTMWDVQTGGIIHTFITKSRANDIAVSPSGDFIACGLSTGFVWFWNIHTKQEGKGLWDNEPVLAICWVAPQELAAITQNFFYLYSITSGPILSIHTSDHVWGMVYIEDMDEFLMGTSKSEGPEKLCSFRALSDWGMKMSVRMLSRPLPLMINQSMGKEKQSPTHPGQLMHPTLVGKEVVCITLPMGVQTFNISSHNWTNNPPLLNMATSVAVSLNRNLVVQTRDSIQIFSTDVLTSGEVHNDRHMSHVYPLDKNCIICVLQPTRHVTILNLETLREVYFDDEISSLWPLPAGEMQPDPILSYDGVFIPNAMQAWWLGTSLHERVELGPEGVPWALHRLSPARTKIVAIFKPINSSWEIGLYDMGHKYMIANLFLGSGGGTVYDLTFSSETRFYVKIDGPVQHVQIPYDITPSPSDPHHPYTITKGEPMPLSESRVPPPYTLDTNCEWVLDAQSRKICWISPGDLRRGDGGHFWAGQWLVMVGGDGVVRKVSFREPEC